MIAILDYPAGLDKLQLIGDMGIMAGVQVQPELRKHYSQDGSESFRIKPVSSIEWA